ncbi:unnamed protein product [Acanthosepion pharaonis]|uniref:Uncharacterized protein n=1 Tax=Acanthosepion pharaonis TaxID=158019 RepID=A0A812DY91_ACAPH|nr:unnamed protein product [Sepia pharaonis]
MKIAGWNLRTLRDEGTQSLTVKTLYKYGGCVACLSEVRLPISGHRIMKVPEPDCVYHLYHSGVEDNSGLYRVAIALSSVARTALLAWEPVSNRLAMNAAEEDKDIFYRDPQAVVDRTPFTDLLVVAADWNARTGQEDEGTRHVLGRFALGTRCDNGDRLVNFAVANRLVVTKHSFPAPAMTSRHLAFQ